VLLLLLLCGFLPPDTPLLQRLASKLPGGKDEVYNALVSAYPLGRLGTAKEIAAAAVFVGTKATFMTGQTLVLDGGGFCR
jgi:NAD(P)-dependent dehydrogenase (short-subunit alcohol dehydrogenase family)